MRVWLKADGLVLRRDTVRIYYGPMAMSTSDVFCQLLKKDNRFHATTKRRRLMNAEWRAVVWTWTLATRLL